MIIINQDKNNVINYDNVKSLWIEDNVLDETNTTFYINADEDFLGEYETEERAKEVLQEIIRALIEAKKFESADSMFGFGIIPANTVYEMPKE